MNRTRNRYPWIVVGIGLVLFVFLPLVRKMEGVKTPMDAYEGTWGGRMTFQIDDPQFWGNVPAPHHDAILYFTLTGQQDDANGYYGPGELYFVGGRAPLPVTITKFRPSKDGSVDFRFDVKSAFYLMLNGKITNGTLVVQAGDPSAPTLRATLNKGTETGFKKQMADAQAQNANGR